VSTEEEVSGEDLGAMFEMLIANGCTWASLSYEGIRAVHFGTNNERQAFVAKGFTKEGDCLMAMKPFNTPDVVVVQPNENK